MSVKQTMPVAEGRDTIFVTTASRKSDFEFNERVAAIFDDMLVRSVPFYMEQQAMIRELAKKFFIPGTCIYDLGCSTGTALVNLGLVYAYLGNDPEMAMALWRRYLAFAPRGAWPSRGKKCESRRSNSSREPVRMPTWKTRSGGTTSITRAMAEA